MSFYMKKSLSELVSSRKRLYTNQLNKDINDAIDELHKYYLRPETADEFEERLRKDELLRRALFKCKNAVFFKALTHVDTKPANFQIAMTGGNGEGKTEATMTLCNLLTKRYKTKILLAFRDQQLLEGLTKAKTDDVVCMDEPKFAHGEGSKVQLDNIINIRNENRYARIHLIIVRTNQSQFSSFTSANWRLEPCGYNEKTGEMRLICYTKKWKPKGHLILKYCSDKLVRKYFRTEKDKDYEQNKQQFGYDFIKIKVKDEDIATVCEFLESKNYPNLSAGDIAVLCSNINDTWNPQYIRKLAKEVSIERKHRKHLTNQAEENALRASTVSLGQYDLEFKLERKYKDEEFLTKFLYHLEKRIRDKTKFEVFKRICYKESPLDIHSELGVATGTVSNYKKEILLKHSGYAGEDAYEDVLKELKHIYERGGENTDEPDFIDHSTREVISFKTYITFRQHKALTHIAEKEIATAKRLNYKLKSLGYDLRECTFFEFLVIISSRLAEHPLPLVGTNGGRGADETAEQTVARREAEQWAAEFGISEAEAREILLELDDPPADPPGGGS